MREERFSDKFIGEAIEVLKLISSEEIEDVVDLIRRVRDRGGRVFFCGSGGGAAHASHATADFRKLAGVEAYCPTDNITELTARTNDDGWERAYSDWLLGSKLNQRDCVFVFSVGGGDLERNISPNLVNAVKVAKEVGAAVTGVVGRDGGALRRLADCSILVPTVNKGHVTAHTEAMQAVLWHLMISHPVLGRGTPKWEASAGTGDSLEEKK